MGKIYKAAMVVIGNEILSGRTQDLNVNYVANKLVACGVSLVEVRVIPDDEAVIIDTIRSLKDVVDYVFTSGGIGPTHDDITAASIAKAFGVELVVNEEVRGVLLAHYGTEELTAPRLKMACIPEGAWLIPNPVSGAPGFVIENVYVMAGVPRIMQAMMDDAALMLQGGAVVHSCTVPCSLTESVIAQGLAEIQDKWTGVDIGSYPYFENGRFGVNIVLRSSDEADLDAAERDVIEMVASTGG